MYATMNNEKVMRSPLTQDAITRNAARRETAATGETLVSWLQRRIRRAMVVRQLSVLDDRLLADIGLERWQIDEVADRVVADAPAAAEPLAAVIGRILRTRVIEPILRAYRRHAAQRELSALDDRLLKDIGLTRSDIPFVAQAVATIESDQRLHGRAEDEERDLVQSFRAWKRRRSVAKELNALDDRMLSDIGLVRGDVDWVAEELALRSLKTPANRNQASEAA